MAKGNGFNAMFSIEFESFESVKKKLDSLQGKLNNELKNGAKIDLKIDTTQITKIMSDLSNLAKNEIKIMPNGEITTLSKFNAELGKTITLKQNLSKNETTIGISDDEEKKLREYTKLFDQAIKQEDELNKVKQSQRDSEWKEMETSYKQEQQFINASQTLKQKASQQTRANAEAEAKISNKLLEDQYKQNQSQKQEMEDAQKLIAYEKQRLDIRLKSINANRGSLVNGNYSAKIQDGINGLSGKSVDEVRTKTKQLNLELQKLDQQARMNGLQVGNKNIMSFGESVKSTATKLGIFASTAMVLNQVGVQFRNATNYVRTLDESMISLKKVTDETNTTYTNFLNNMHNVAMEFGTQSNYMVDAVTNWAKTGKTLEEASKLAESTILLTKVGDVQSVDTAQQYMIAPLKAFNIEAEKSIELIDKYNNISNNMSTTVGDVGDALSQSASSMATAGNSLEQTIAMIAAAESATKLGGNTIGNALKTMSMRLATFKDDETGEVIPKMAEQLKELTNVDITDMNGQLRNTYDIYMDIGKVYKELDKNSQLQINEILGGKRQGNIVGAILADTDELQRAFDLASNSAGSAMKEFETYQEGIQYSIDVLKEQINGLYTSFINGGFIKGFVDGSASIIGGINSLTSSLGTIPVVITTVVGALTLFNSKFRETTQMMLGFVPSVNKVFTALNTVSNSFKSQSNVYVDQIASLKRLTLEYQKVGMSTSGFGKTLAGLNIKLALSTTAMIATKVAAIALQTAMSMALTMGVSLLISGFSKLVDNLITTKSELAELNESSLNTFKTNKDIVSSVETLISKETELKNKLKDTSLSYDEQNTYKGELLEIQRNLATILPESATGFDNEGNKISENTEKVLENLDAKKKLSEQEAIKSINKNDSYETLIEAPEKYDTVKKQLQEMQDAYRNNEEYMGREVTSKWIDKIQKKVDEYEKAIEITSASIEALRGAGWTEERIAQELFKDMPFDTAMGWYNKLIPVVDSYTNELNKSTDALDENTKAKEENANAGDSENQVDSTSIEEATKAYGDAVIKAQEYDAMLQKIAESGGMTADIISELATKYPDMGSAIFDAASAQEYLNGKIQEQVDVQASAYETMIGNDQTYYSTRLQNAEELQAQFNELASQFVDVNSEGYNFDVKNFRTLNEAKAGFGDQLNNAMAEYISKFVGGNKDAYAVDLKNMQTLAEKKAYIINQMNSQLRTMQRNLQSFGQTTSNTFESFANATEAKYGIGTQKTAKEMQFLADQIKNVQGAIEDVDTAFGGFSASFSNYTPTFGVGSSIGSGTTDKGSSAAEKEIADLESLGKRYVDLNAAITKVENSLKALDIAQENVSDEDRIKLIKQEIELLNQKKIALQNLQKEQNKEMGELRNSLSVQGFKFDDNGSIKNINAQLESLRQNANSLSGEAKEGAIANVKAIADSVERYNELLLQLVPDTQNSIDDIKNTIIDAQKEIVSQIQDEYNEWKDKEEKKTQKLKDEINKRKEIMNKEWEAEDYADELDSEQQKLNELQSARQDALRTGNEELVKSLDKQIAEQQKNINDIIRDQERNNANDKYDEVLDGLDKELEAKLNAMDDKMKDDVLLGKVQAGAVSLSDIFGQINTSSDNLNKNMLIVGDSISLWNTNLDSFISKLNTIQPNLALNLNGSIDGISRSSGQPVINVTTNIGVTGGTSLDEDTLEDMFDKNNKIIIKQVNESFKR